MPRFLTPCLILVAYNLPCVFAAEPVTKNLYPAGGGHFTVSLSPCSSSGTAAVLSGTLTNQTDATWLYIEIQVQVTQGTSTATYRLNLERIGPKGGVIRQRIDGPADQDCGSIRLSGVELIAAYSESRAGAKKR
jgi:hypothetical protein